MIELVRPGELVYRLSDSNGCDEYYLFFTPPPRGEYLKTDIVNWRLARDGALYLIGRPEGDEFYSSNGCRVYIFRSDNPNLLFSTPEGAPFGWRREYGGWYYYFMIMPAMLDRLKLFIKDGEDIVLFEEWKGQLEVDYRNDPGYGWWELKPPRGSSGEDDDDGEIWIVGKGGVIVAERGDEVKWL
jgi:hypothetical protein